MTIDIRTLDLPAAIEVAKANAPEAKTRLWDVVDAYILLALEMHEWRTLDTARYLGVSKKMVVHWKKRYNEAKISGAAARTQFLNLKVGGNPSKPV